MFNPSSEKILEKGINSLSLACQLLEKENKELKVEIKTLEERIEKLIQDWESCDLLNKADD